MGWERVCLHCFADRGNFDVCPYCGFVAHTVPAEGYIIPPGIRLWGRYVIGTVLGTGGFGITYRAWDTRLSALVAIKEFFPQNLVTRNFGETKVRVYSGEEQEEYRLQLARFMEEAKNLAKFTGDSHIVNVMDFFEDNGTAYIVMEFLDGVTLKQHLALSGGFLPAGQALSIGDALLSALTSIHKKSIIHRDISPDNIIIRPDGSMKLLDFGAARFAAQQGSDLTQGVVVKKGYAPPEQYRSNMKQGVWTDIYAAGATLYKMLTGITPEESIERTEKDLLRPPGQLGFDVPAYVDKSIMKAMALRPDLRFKSAAAMQGALDNQTLVDLPEEQLQKRKKRGGLLVAASLLLVVGIAALLGWRMSTLEPEIITQGPALQVGDIQPDTITLWLIKGEEEEMHLQLARAFEKKYPQFTLQIQMVSREERDSPELAERMQGENGPTVLNFGGYRNEKANYADLSPLLASMDLRDYCLLEEWMEDEKKDAETGEKAIYNLPVGFEFSLAHVSALMAREMGIEEPACVESFDQIVDWATQWPGSVEGYAWNADMIVQLAVLDVQTDADYQKLEDAFVQYALLGRDGYLGNNGYYREDRMDYPMLGVSYSYSGQLHDNLINDWDAGPLIPFVHEGKIFCDVRCHYYVNGNVSENKQKAGMLYLHFLLSEYAQNTMHVQFENYQPLHKKALEDYVTANPQVAFLTDTYKDKLRYTPRLGYYMGEEVRNLLDEDITDAERSVQYYQREGEEIPADIEEKAKTARADYEERLRRALRKVRAEDNI